VKNKVKNRNGKSLFKYTGEAYKKLIAREVVYGFVSEEYYQEIINEYVTKCEEHIFGVKRDEKKGDPNESDLP